MQVLPVSLGSSCIPVRSHHTDMFPVNQTHSNSIGSPRHRREGPLSRDLREVQWAHGAWASLRACARRRAELTLLTRSQLSHTFCRKEKMLDYRHFDTHLHVYFFSVDFTGTRFLINLLVKYFITVFGYIYILNILKDVCLWCCLRLIVNIDISWHCVHIQPLFTRCQDISILTIIVIFWNSIFHLTNTLMITMWKTYKLCSVWLYHCQAKSCLQR